MNQPPDPLDELLRRSFKDAAGPAEAARDRARGRLDAAIRNEKNKRRHRTPIRAAAAIAAVVIGTVAIWTSTSTPPVMAAMEELAQAAETGPQLTGPQQYLYTDATTQRLTIVPRDALGDVDYPHQQLAFVAVSRRQTWYGNSGSVQIRETVEAPEFFRSEDANAYYTAHLDRRHNVGESVLETFPQVERPTWPSDPGLLDEAIREAVATGRGLSEDIEYLDVALDIVAASPAAPKIRAETLLLIGRLDEVEILDREADGTVTFRVRYELNGVDTEHLFSIDSNGYLTSEQITALSGDDTLRIPPATTVYEMIVEEQRITRSLEVP